MASVMAVSWSDRGPIDQVEGIDVGGQHLERPLRNGGQQPESVVRAQALTAGGDSAGQHVAEVAAQLAVAPGDQYPQRSVHGRGTSTLRSARSLSASMPATAAVYSRGESAVVAPGVGTSTRMRVALATAWGLGMRQP